MEAINEQINKRFNLLKGSFNKRYNKSMDKVTLLKSEIAAHEMLFGYKKLPAFIDTLSSYRPLKNLSYTVDDIRGIRDAYEKYIVNGADIDKSVVLFNYKGTIVRQEPTPVELQYYIEAKVRYLYLKWLKDPYSFPENQPDKLIDTAKPIIENMYLELIFKHFKEWFPDETKETWIKRFVYPNNDAISPIKIAPAVKVDNDRLVLIAILGAIQDSDKTNF